MGRSCLGGGGLMDEFKAAILRHAVGQPLGEAEGIASVNAADRLGLLVADIDDPDWNLFAIGGSASLRAFKENATPRRTRGAEDGNAVCRAKTGGQSGIAWGWQVHTRSGGGRVHGCGFSLRRAA